MGLFGGIGNLFAGGSDAADIFEKFAQEGIGELRRQFDITQGNVDPFIQAGTGQLPGLEAGATPQGLDARLRDIFSGDSFGNLVDERTRAVQGQLAAGGLTRSGTALQEIADVPTDLGFQIEQLLSGRSQNLAKQGLGAGLGLGEIGSNNAANIASLLKSIGQQQSSGALLDTQAGTNFASQLFSSLGS